MLHDHREVIAIISNVRTALFMITAGVEPDQPRDAPAELGCDATHGHRVNPPIPAESGRWFEQYAAQQDVANA